MSSWPSITLEDATRVPWDAIVVGAGPAGAMVARETARRGVRVLLLDKARFPRRKVCGCCLNLRALATLEAAGLGSLPARHGALPLRRIRLGVSGRTATVPLPGGVSLSRETLDSALVSAAQYAGVAFLEGTRAVGTALEDDERVVRVRAGDGTADLRARVVVAADGLAGSLLRADGVSSVPVRSARIGAGVTVDNGPAAYEPGTVYMACGRGGYVGLVRLEDGRLDVAAALDTAVVRRNGLGRAAVDILASAGFPAVTDLEERDWRGTPVLTRRPAAVAGHRLFAVGDAAGYIEPFTGEGIAWALVGAVALAPLAARAAERYDPAIERAWEAALDRRVRRRQRICRTLAAGLRRPLLVRTAVLALSRRPGLAGAVVRSINAPRESRGTASP